MEQSLLGVSPAPALALKAKKSYSQYEPEYFLRYLWPFIANAARLLMTV